MGNRIKQCEREREREGNRENETRKNRMFFFCILLMGRDGEKKKMKMGRRNTLGIPGNYV